MEADGDRMLAVLEREASQHEEWQSFADYCHFRRTGLRSQSINHLKIFIQSALSWDFEHRKEFVSWLLSTGEISFPSYFPSPKILPQPLSDQLIKQTLDQWANNEPTNTSCLRWRGKWYTGITDLRRALALNPNDQLTRYAMVRQICLRLWNSVHELDRGIYRGDPVEDLALANEVFHLKRDLEENEKTKILKRAVADMKQLIEDYTTFKQQDSGDITQWYLSKDRQFDWSRVDL